MSEPGEPVNEVAEITPEKTSVSFVPTDGSAELKLLINGEPEQVDEVRYLDSISGCIADMFTGTGGRDSRA